MAETKNVFVEAPMSGLVWRLALAISQRIEEGATEPLHLLNKMINTQPHLKEYAFIPSLILEYARCTPEGRANADRNENLYKLCKSLPEVNLKWIVARWQECFGIL